MMQMHQLKQSTNYTPMSELLSVIRECLFSQTAVSKPTKHSVLD